MSRCFLKSFAPAGMRECDGPVQGHHVIKQQTIKRAMKDSEPTRGFAPDYVIRAYKQRLGDVLSDRRNLLQCCKRHHDMWHSHRRSEFSLTRDDLPEGLELFAAEHGLEHELDRQFGVGFVPEEATQ
jgi:hypothetical protein